MFTDSYKIRRAYLQTVTKYVQLVHRQLQNTYSMFTDSYKIRTACSQTVTKYVEHVHR